MKQGHVQKILSVHHLYLLSYIMSPSAMKTPENTEDPEPSYEGDTQMQYYLISCTAQVKAQ